MRTTIDVPEDLLHTVRQIARDREQTLSRAAVELMRRGLQPTSPGTITTSPVTGLPVLHVGRTITTEDVRALDDEEVDEQAAFLTSGE